MPSFRADVRAGERSAPGAAPPDPRLADIAKWLGQLARTLKTCRLYDAQNPNALKFREDLGSQMASLLETHGSFTLEFSGDEILCDGEPLRAGRTREDDIAMPFHRDGLRTLRFNPGTSSGETDAIVDAILRVTGRAGNGSEDLVTLLWDAALPHVDMSYVATETDADLADEGEVISPDDPMPRRGRLMPWPEVRSESGPAGTGSGGTTGAPDSLVSDAEAQAAPGNPAAANAQVQLRSDDWLAGEPAQDLEQCFGRLEATSAADAELLLGRMREERGARLVPGALALVREVLRSDLNELDRADLAELVARTLRDTIHCAHWADAGDAARCLSECSDGWWETAELVTELASPGSETTAMLVHHLDTSPLAELQEFIGFARGLGPAAIEWLMAIVSLASHQRTRRTLLGALSELCGGNPERLAPWLSDPRWYVVRNVVGILAHIEGGAPVGLFRPLLRHPEVRVRQAVVEALSTVELEAALPLLLDLVFDPEASVRGAVLHRLGAQRSPRVSTSLLAVVRAPEFRDRPADDVRAFLAALGGCADDDALPLLEEQLYPPKQAGRNAGTYCQAVARCIVRIGTPSAIERLERGSLSRIPATRDACRLVLKGLGHA